MVNEDLLVLYSQKLIDTEYEDLIWFHTSYTDFTHNLNHLDSNFDILRWEIEQPDDLEAMSLFKSVSTESIIQDAKKIIETYNTSEDTFNVMRFITLLLARNNREYELYNIIQWCKDSYKPNLSRLGGWLIDIADRLFLYKQDFDLALKYYDLCYTINNQPKSKKGRNLSILIGNLLSLRRTRFPENKKDLADIYYKIRKIPFSSRIILEEDKSTILECWKELETNSTNGSQKRITYAMLHGIRKRLLPCILFNSLKDHVTELSHVCKRNLTQATILYGIDGNKEIQTFLKNQEQSNTSKLFDYLTQICLIIEKVEEIEGELKYTRLDDKILGYYTSINTAKYILPEKNLDESKIQTEYKDSAFCDMEAIKNCGYLTVMDINYMNDPNEGRTYLKYIYKNLKNIDDFPDEEDYIFIKCFTLKIDDLTMWEMYGDHSKGCCIEFDTEAESPFFSSSNNNLYKVCYIKTGKNSYTINKEDNQHIDKQKLPIIKQALDTIKNIINERKGNDDFLSLVYGLLKDTKYMFKDSAYSNEREVRLIKRLHPRDKDIKIVTKDDIPMLCIKMSFPLYVTEVLLGPNVGKYNRIIPYLRSQLDLLSYKNNTKRIKLTHSSIEFLGN